MIFLDTKFWRLGFLDDLFERWFCFRFRDWEGVGRAGEGVGLAGRLIIYLPPPYLRSYARNHLCDTFYMQKGIVWRRRVGVRVGCWGLLSIPLFFLLPILSGLVFGTQL